MSQTARLKILSKNFIPLNIFYDNLAVKYILIYRYVLHILLQNGYYGTVSEVAGDLNILFENAKKVNKPDSKLYKVNEVVFLLNFIKIMHALL